MRGWRVGCLSCLRSLGCLEEPSLTVGLLPRSYRFGATVSELLHQREPATVSCLRSVSLLLDLAILAFGLRHRLRL